MEPQNTTQRTAREAVPTDTRDPGLADSGALPGDATEGGSPGTAPPAGTSSQDEIMQRLEAQRGQQAAGMPVEGVHLGTPAGGAVRGDGAEHWGEVREDEAEDAQPRQSASR